MSARFRFPHFVLGALRAPKLDTDTGGGTNGTDVMALWLARQCPNPPAGWTCNAGYYEPGGDSCATCDVGSWCPGGATITPCPDHMISAPGSDSLSDCTCKEGYSAGLSVEGTLCEATDVSREVSTITLAVTLSMSASEFNSQMRRSAYIDGVARALKVESSAVQIKSVQEQSSERRRRLLATTCLVETTVTVTLSTPFLGMQATCFGCGFH